MLARGFEKPAQHLDRLLKRLGELSLFLVPPGAFEVAHASMQAGNQALQVGIKPVQILRETSQFRRIDIGFAHRLFSLDAIRINFRAQFIALHGRQKVQ
jgi:hypothetical protein